MRRIENEGDIVAYLVDCTLATVSSMAMKKRRPKWEYLRQIRIAQTGIEQMDKFAISRHGTRAENIDGTDVVLWAQGYEQL